MSQIDSPQSITDYLSSLRTESDIIRTWGGADNPLVTIYCITYNHRNYIAEALSGFLSQRTTFPFEILVHDDASTDGTDCILRSFQHQYPGLIRTVLQSQNQFSQGASAYRFLAPLVRGELVASCEGDDYWTDENKLQLQVEALQANPHCVLAYHDYFVIDETGRTLVPSVLKGRGRDVPGRKLVSGRHIGVNIHTSTIMYRWKERLPPPPEMAGCGNGDRVLRAMLGLKGDAVFVPGVGPSMYRKHPGGITTGTTQERRVSNSMASRLAAYRYFQRIGETEAADLIWRDFLRSTAKTLSIKDWLLLGIRTIRLRCTDIVRHAVLRRPRTGGNRQ